MTPFCLLLGKHRQQMKEGMDIGKVPVQNLLGQESPAVKEVRMDLTHTRNLCICNDLLRKCPSLTGLCFLPSCFILQHMCYLQLLSYVLFLFTLCWCLEQGKKPKRSLRCNILKCIVQFWLRWDPNAEIPM